MFSVSKYEYIKVCLFTFLSNIRFTLLAGLHSFLLKAILHPRVHEYCMVLLRILLVFIGLKLQKVLDRALNGLEVKCNITLTVP